MNMKKYHIHLAFSTKKCYNIFRIHLTERVIFLGRYELSEADNQLFFISKQKLHINKTLKVFHKHSHFEVLITKSNDTTKSYYITENGMYSFTSKSILLSHPHLKHRTERNTKNTTRFLVCFRRSFIEPIAQFMDIDIDLLFSKRVLNYTEDKIEEIISIANKMIEEFKISKNYEQNKELRLLLASFLYKISQYEFEGTATLNKENMMTEICDYLKYNYKENITLEQLSERFCINKYELCRKMKKIYGCTVNDIITNVRINKAKELLEDTDLSIVDISDKVGYNSSEYFSKKFKKYTGFSPKSYRNKN